MILKIYVLRNNPKPRTEPEYFLIRRFPEICIIIKYDPLTVNIDMLVADGYYFFFAFNNYCI